MAIFKRGEYRDDHMDKVKIGIEVHQQLNTNKLFCSCPYRLIGKEAPDLIIQRRLHPVFSELGEVDEASMIEYKKDRVFEYQVFHTSNCLVEIDEEPPHRINQEALDIALEIAIQLRSKPIEEVHVMRKTVIDGSNTSGFQRTAIVALGGYVDSSNGKVGITQIAVEEESAGIVSADENKVTYKLDRLGIPLVEITTEPEIKDGAHLYEVAEKIGMILRATGRVARGLGTIRQDVNISIEGGTRVEIKGAQDLKLLPLLVDTEVKRQKALIAISEELKKKNAKPSNTQKDLTKIFSSTNSKIIQNGLKNNQAVLGLKLEGYAGILGREIQPGKRYGTELSDYAKSGGVKGIIHSDEDLSKYQISNDETNSVKKELGVSNKDAFVLIVAKPDNRAALENVIKRASMLRVPEETRRTNEDGTTNYMRPLPGKARLYPETDVPAIAITKDMLKRINSGKAESLEDKRKKLEELLNKEFAEKILKSKYLKLFEKLLETNVEPMIIATTLENTLVSLRREGFGIADLEKMLLEIFQVYKQGKFVKSAIPEILKLMSKDEDNTKTVENALEKGNLYRIRGKELKKIAEEFNYDVQKIMQKYRLQIDVADLQKLINERK